MVKITADLLAEIERESKAAREDGEALGRFVRRMSPEMTLALVEQIRGDQAAIDLAIFDITATWRAIYDVAPQKVVAISRRIEALRALRAGSAEVAR